MTNDRLHRIEVWSLARPRIGAVEVLSKALSALTLTVSKLAHEVAYFCVLLFLQDTETCTWFLWRTNPSMLNCRNARLRTCPCPATGSVIWLIATELDSLKNPACLESPV